MGPTGRLSANEEGRLAQRSQLSTHRPRLSAHHQAQAVPTFHSKACVGIVESAGCDQRAGHPSICFRPFPYLTLSESVSCPFTFLLTYVVTEV